MWEMGSGGPTYIRARNREGLARRALLNCMINLGKKESKYVSLRYMYAFRLRYVSGQFAW